jgi:hypothetical protein
MLRMATSIEAMMPATTKPSPMVSAKSASARLSSPSSMSAGYYGDSLLIVS